MRCYLRAEKEPLRTHYYNISLENMSRFLDACEDLPTNSDVYGIFDINLSRRNLNTLNIPVADILKKLYFCGQARKLYGKLESFAHSDIISDLKLEIRREIIKAVSEKSTSVFN